MPNRDTASLVPARLWSRATSLEAVRGSIATTPFRVVCGPTTTTLLPTMIHPSSVAADLRRPDDVYADAGKALRFADLTRKSRPKFQTETLPNHR